MSVAQRKAAAKRISLRYPAPRTRKKPAQELVFGKKGQKISKRRSE